jgi:hypothetical protein
MFPVRYTLELLYIYYLEEIRVRAEDVITCLDISHISGGR